MNDIAPLMLSVSGARGIVGESMTPEVASGFARAFASVVKEASGRNDALIILGRDSRPSGEKLARNVTQGLVSAGCRVIDLGIAMTPTVGVMVQERRAAGGMVITASHNPAQWNGLKCLNQVGAAPPNPVAERIIERFRSTSPAPAAHTSAVPGLNQPRLTHDSSANQVHIDRVLRALGEESLAGIRAARFNVVLDSINGAGCVPGRMLLESLGCEVIQLNGEPNGNFAHTPEPVEENLRDLCAAVRDAKSHIGFAQDPDGDRLAIVDEQGTYIGEEYTLVLCVLRALERAVRPLAPGSAGGHRGARGDSEIRGGAVNEDVGRKAPAEPEDQEIILAANLSTSRMIDDVAATFPELRARVIRTAVGEANVVAALMEAQARGECALLGGEGNGGVIVPEVCWVRDSLISMALVLDFLASRISSPPSPSGRGVGGEGDSSLSEIVATLPRYTMIKRKFAASALGGQEAIAPMLAKVKTEFSNRTKHPDARINDTDGIRIDFPDGWIHLRPSNTEPVVRLIAEAKSPIQCDALIRQVGIGRTPPPAT